MQRRRKAYMLVGTLPAKGARHSLTPSPSDQPPSRPEGLERTT